MDEGVEFSEEDLNQIIASSKEGSVVKQRFKFLGNLNHEVRNAIGAAKGFFDVLVNEGLIFPPDIVYDRTEEKIVGGQKTTVTRRVNCLSEALALFDSFSLGFTCTKLVVGVGLEDIFRQLKGEDAAIPKNLTPEVIIRLGIEQTREAFERSRERFTSFFSENEPTNIIDDEVKARQIITKGIKETIDVLKRLSEEFFGPEKPQEPED